MLSRTLLLALTFSISLAALGCKTSKPAEDTDGPKETSPAEATPESQPAKADKKLPPCEPDDENCRVERLGAESVGWITGDITVEKVKEKLGEPEEKGERNLWEATGDHVETWTWKSAGVQLDMTAPDMTSPVNDIYSVTVFAPFDGKTSRGVGIGSSAEEVREAYEGMIEEGTSREDLIIAGSIYGGAFFRIKDGAVESIFIGAGAE